MFRVIGFRDGETTSCWPGVELIILTHSNSWRELEGLFRVQVQTRGGEVRRLTQPVSNGFGDPNGGYKKERGEREEGGCVCLTRKSGQR